MTIRQSMLAAAARAAAALGESTGLVRQFVRGRLTSEGGFRGRSDRADLYYTVFGLECLLAVSDEVPRETVRAYLASFGDGEGLDFVHLNCLIRCRADLGFAGPAEPVRAALAARLAAFRTHDGGFGPAAGGSHGTAYGCFLAASSHEDLALAVARPEGLVQCLESLRSGDGGYANHPGSPIGQTPAAAAAACTLAALGQDAGAELGAWLLDRCAASGGFPAVEGAPMPDLLSTATALHALATIGVPIDPVRERCLEYLDTLWDGHGGFRGTDADDQADCEYTYYALLALGHLGE